MKWRDSQLPLNIGRKTPFCIKIFLRKIVFVKNFTQAVAKWAAFRYNTTIENTHKIEIKI
ncbi:hypothetical protein TRIP_C10050 [Candidatus Zixiibacteriota bacterium]|nr:hypothetical protein TRIP_C10050 [candidate division Zixibacteria bacterium]